MSSFLMTKFTHVFPSSFVVYHKVFNSFFIDKANVKTRKKRHCQRYASSAFFTDAIGFAATLPHLPLSFNLLQQTADDNAHFLACECQQLFSSLVSKE
jgi:hypothetical protein